MQVDVEEPGAHGVELVVLHDRVVRLLLAFEDDVEDRVQTMVARERLAELALLDRERMRLVPVPVEDAGDHSFTPQASRVAGSPALALAHG